MRPKRGIPLKDNRRRWKSSFSAQESRREFGDEVTAELASRFRHTVATIAAAPKSGSRVVTRPGVCAFSLVRCPFKIYYRIGKEAAEILHIHHTSRRS
jgi:plasmid stabilization system protein ParE